MFDLIIKNGIVLDGLGGEAVRQDIAIQDDYIAAISPTLPTNARYIINAAGRVVCPGFIDMHSHSGLVVFEQPDLLPKIKQGITTEVIGLDGISAAPVTTGGLAERKRYLMALDSKIDMEWSWRTFPEYLACLRTLSPSTNLVPLIPHGAVRDVVMGLNNVPANPAEIKQMRLLVEEAFSCGAKGLSFGLIYMPGAYAQPEELMALTKVASWYDGLVAVHVRNEAEYVVDSINEMVEMAYKADAKVHISHLKIIGTENQHQLPHLLNIFEQCAQTDIRISFDQYPYIAGSTQLAVLLPPWAHSGGPSALMSRLQSSQTRQKIKHDMLLGLPGWENLYHCCGWDKIVVASILSANDQPYVGHSISQIAQHANRDPFNIVFDLLIENRLQVGMIDYYGDERVMKAILKSPYQTVGTDGIFSKGSPHPRLYGTYPRILGRYVRDEGVLSLTEAVRKMTSRPAQLLSISDRGVLKTGYKADIVIFDPQTVIDRATYQTPNKDGIGIEWVIVNGKITVDNMGRVKSGWGEVII